MSEIGGPECLPAYLEDAAIGGVPESHSVVVIDTICSLDQPISIPPGVTIRGTGIYGAGILAFSGLPRSTPAITMGRSRRLLQIGTTWHSALEDIQVSRVGLNSPTQGVAISIDGPACRVRNVRINSGPAFGIAGTARARNVAVDHVQIIENHTGIFVGGSNWRIRHPFIRNCHRWGISIKASNVLVEGGRFEDNGDPTIFSLAQRGAIVTSGDGTVIQYNYFEQNGYDGALNWAGTAVCLHPYAYRSRCIGNFLAADAIAFGDAAISGQIDPPLPYPVLFNALLQPTPELLPSIMERRHTIALNTIDAPDLFNPYAGRFLITASLASIELDETP